jgi:hypothetical protein
MASGKEIFDELEQYRLPAETGVRDYIFYFVSANDGGYGGGAHDFFNKFYPKHVAKEVSSLEQMIGALYTDVTRGVQRIPGDRHRGARHAARIDAARLRGRQRDESARVPPHHREDALLPAEGLRRREVRDAETTARGGDRPPVRRFVGDHSRLPSGSFAVYACMPTIPSSAATRNVYAPREYQFFGSQHIDRGARVETRLQMHEHLVKQHFLSNDEHTPDRKDAIVRALIDPATFSAPVQLASMRVDADPTDAAPYEALIDDLNAGKLSSALQAAFAAAGDPLSSKAYVRVQDKDHRWLVTDTVDHPDGPFLVDCDVDEEINGQVAALMASGRVRANSTGESFPMQLFFYQGDEDLFNGKLFTDGKPFTLAACVDGSGADAANKQKFDAGVALLNGNKYTDGTVYLKVLFKEAS